MSCSIRWTEWNLTAAGWIRGPTVDSPGEARQHRPAETLLTLIGWRLAIEPDAKLIVSEVFRSPDTDAVADAMAKYGPKPKD
ncbi:MAG: hypothetical protein DCC68_25400 [Planctomycetota bacterium]|nr:MAG: hypothetical protein DCC68_25400 [Planctomycetota bacterium]